MSLLGRLRKELGMDRRQDPAVAKQIADAAHDVRESGRLLREIRAVQGELERSRPSHREKPWASKSSSSH